MALDRGGALHINQDRLLIICKLVDVKMVIQSLLGWTLRDAVHLNLIKCHFLKI